MSSTDGHITTVDMAGLSTAVQQTLTKDEQETLSHLLRRGMGENTLRAVRSDLAYLEAWSLACDGEHLSWPPSKETALRFIAHHLWDPDERAKNARHGMPDHVRDFLEASGHLRAPGPHATSTVERRISSWRSMCKWQELEHPFNAVEFTRTLRSAIRASGTKKKRKSKKSVDVKLMEELLDQLDVQARSVGQTAEEIGYRLRAKRDRALLAVMFSSGGRRRSEISNLMCGQIIPMDPIDVTDVAWPDGIPSAGIHLGRTKTTDSRDEASVFMTGRAVLALKDWMVAAGISSGPVFLRVDRWGKIFKTSISPHSVNEVLKKRLAEIGLEPRDYSAHGVRAGYITSALKSGIPAPEIMEQTLHRSLDTLMGYFKDEQQRQGRAARLL